MTNKYLTKIASILEKQSNDEDDSSDNWPVAGALIGAGALALRHATPKLLGYTKVFHGTTKANANSIRKTGLLPSYGGSEIGSGHRYKAHMENLSKGQITAEDRELNEMISQNFKKQSKGKVHVTKVKDTAKYFAGVGNTEKAVLTARIPHSHWSSMEKDPHMGLGSTKYDAATSTKPIPANQIGSHPNTVLQYANKKHLGEYLSSTEGKTRFAKGVGFGTAGIGSIGAGGALINMNSTAKNKSTKE